MSSFQERRLFVIVIPILVYLLRHDGTVDFMACIVLRPSLRLQFPLDDPLYAFYKMHVTDRKSVV